MRDRSRPALLISGPGASPENIFRYQAPDGTEKNAYISIGNTCDHEIARETLADTLEAAGLLGLEDDFMRFLRQRFPETQFDFIAAGIPSLGSVPHAFRLGRAVFARYMNNPTFQNIVAHWSACAW